MTKTMKQFVQEYQAGKTDSLNHLLQFKTIDKVTRLQFADKKLNFLLQKLSNSDINIPYTDYEQWFIDSLYRIDDNGKEMGIFNTTKIKKYDDPENKEEYSPQEIWKYIEKTVSYYIHNQIERSSLYGKKSDGLHGTQVITDTFTDEDGNDEALNTDQASYNDWETATDMSTDAYDSYLDVVGDVQGILTAIQYRYWEMKVAGHTDQEIADEYKVNQSTVTESITSSKKRIKSGYLSFKSMQILCKDDGNPFIIANEFIKQYEAVRDVDAESIFDYYSFTRNFMLKHISERDMEDNFELLALNKPVVVSSFYDTLMENGKKGSHNLLQNGLDGKLTVSRDRDRFVTSVHYSLNRIIKNHKKEIDKCSVGIVR